MKTDSLDRTLGEQISTRVCVCVAAENLDNILHINIFSAHRHMLSKTLTSHTQHNKAHLYLKQPVGNSVSHIYTTV